MHLSNDIYEKLIVSAWSIFGIGAITLSCVMADSHAKQPQSTDEIQASIRGDADDFEGEFLEPQVPILSTKRPASASSRHLVQYNGKYFSYGRAFANRNNQHLEAAERIGLNPGPENRAAAEKMGNQLREIRTNDNYVVEELTHSLPYLVPVAADRLDSIGQGFADLLAHDSLPKYRFRVTSVLRSQEDIRRLQRCNPNSVSNSPHNYGTTFDIGYAHFDQAVQTNDSMTEDNLKLVLAQVLLNEQRAGHIYVKYEHKQGCFHITARN